MSLTETFAATKLKAFLNKDWRIVMKLNVGTWDRMLRVFAGMVLGLLLFMGIINISTGLGIAAAVAAAILIVTGAVSFCPAYSIFGLRTRS